MKRIVGRKSIEEQCPEILFDESRFSLGVPDEVVFPESREDLIGVVTGARDKRQPLTIIGGQTGITGGSVPVDGSVAIGFAAMDRIHRVDWQDPERPVLVCEPGVTLDSIVNFLGNPGAWPYSVPGAEQLGDGQFFYPPDPTEMTAQLGGTVATNASGARSFRFGATRNHIESLSLVMADGDTLQLRRGQVTEHNGSFETVSDQGTKLTIPAPAYVSPRLKNASGFYAASGMDLVDLLIGSEGTLAIFAAIGVRLSRRPNFLGGLTFFHSRQRAFDFADFLRVEQQVAAIEYFDETALKLLVDNRERLPFDLPDIPLGTTCAVYWEYIDVPEAPFENDIARFEQELGRAGSSLDMTWSGFERAEMDRLKAFRHAVPELVNSLIAHYKSACPVIRKISTDTAIPGSVFRDVFAKSIDMIRSANIACAAFGHLGDFHVHINMLPRSERELEAALEIYRSIMDLTIGHGGTVSAEHGVGKIKKAYLHRMYGDESIAQMQRIKRALDPSWALNPGNLFEAPRSDGDPREDPSR